MSSRLLRNDNISASIPSYIREIQSLTQLDLSFNNIAGQIPDFPFNLSSLLSCKIPSLHNCVISHNIHDTY
uniref:Leucine-rich repeat-containing N-terminal plant-type domain-containing protein n=1 Tax=Salix viminalis TaxID=40686 RepID=A0A6N2N1L1_SALVM